MHAWQEPRHRLVSFIEADTLVVTGLNQFGTIDERSLLHLLRRYPQRRLVEAVRGCFLFGLAGWQILDRGVFRLRLFQLIANALELNDQLEELALVGKGFERWRETVLLNVARIIERLARLRQQRPDLSFEALRAGRLPECGSRLLHLLLYGFAAPLLQPQHPVCLLPGAIVAHAKIENVPGKAQIRGAHIAIGGSRGNQ